MKLWVIMVGGYPPGSHLEVHDVRFAAAERLEDTFPQLKREWWGGPDRFHIDAWGTLEWIDGHDVVVAQEAPENADTEQKLWFIHLGGYRKDYFGELHDEALVVAPDKGTAKKRALAKAEGWDSPHRDVLIEAESTIDVAEAAGARVFLVPQPVEKPFKFTSDYMPKLDD